MADEIWLIRHGETEWSVSGQHTGLTDIPLTENGRKEAEAVKPKIETIKFDLVLESPLIRAKETCEIAGLSAHAQTDPDLVEWKYGEYEGKSTPDIRKDLKNPDWTIWDEPPQDGENLEEVSARADRVVARLEEAEGKVALFSHGHYIRILTMRWLKLPAVTGRLFLLGTSAVTVLTTQRGYNVLRKWNT